MASPPSARGERASVGIGAALLLVGAFLQAPGKILPETKLDLLLEPTRFLSRALHLWDPSQSFGQLQNQAAGYLLPMGPVYALGHAVGIPPWIVQRIWIGGLLAFGFWGVHRLARALRLGTPVARWIGAMAYVLGPASLTLVAFRSGTQVPVYALPWVLVPLVEADRHGPRRAAARSAIAVALMGGVNGTASLLVLGVPVLWFLTRAAGPARRKLAAWWAAGVVAATAWWALPLALQGEYGYAFTDYTESATLTTMVSSGTEVLRGTGNWLAYLANMERLWLPGGWEMIANRFAIVGGLAVVAAGVAGLARRDLAERRWLTLSALAGAVVMVAGYQGPLGSPFWSTARSLLDGPLVALRNVNKAQPMVALPIVLGAIHLFGVVQARVGAAAARRAAPSRRVRPIAVGAVALVAVVAVALGGYPFFHGRAGADGTFAEVPSYWRQAGVWLDRHADGNTSVVLPASSFGEFTWGRPLDDPLASSTDQPIAVRDIVPLGSNGATRLLDGLEAQLQDGRIEAGTPAVLARSGVQYLVIRNDLDPERTNALPPAQIRGVLAAAPDITRVAAFGPVVPGRATSDQLLPTQDRDHALRAVEIYRVRPAATRVDAYVADRSTVVGGEPEALYDLATAGVLGQRGAVLSGDPLAPAGNVLDRATPAVNDASRRRDVGYGDVRFTESYTLSPTEPAPGTDHPPEDRLVVPGTSHLATARLQGAASVRSSSYGLDTLTREPPTQPWAAFDGDPTTAWRAGLGAPKDLDHTVGAWVELDLDRPADLRSATITIPAAPLAPRATTITVSTDRGQVAAVPRSDGTVTVGLPRGATSAIRFTISQIQPGAEVLGAPGITDVRIPGLSLSRPIATATAAPTPSTDPTPAQVVLTRDASNPFARDPSPEDSELDRIVTTTVPTTLSVAASAVPRPGPGLDALVASIRGPERAAVTGTSTWSGQPAFAPANATDGDATTAWVAADDDPNPLLTVHWPSPQVLDRLVVTTLAPPGTDVDTLILTAPSGEVRKVPIDPAEAGGEVRFPALTTDQVTIGLAHHTEDGRLIGAAGPGSATGLAEIRFPGVDGGRPATTTERGAPFALPCGQGPTIDIDGTAMQTQVRGTLGDLLDARPIAIQPCGTGSVAWRAGSHRIRAGREQPLQVQSVALAPVGATTPTARAASRTTTIRSWGDEARTVEVGAGGRSLLALTENANIGWRATLDSKELPSTRVDGWRQAWVVPAGAGGLVHIDFEPDGTYRLGLLAGMALLIGLAAAALVPSRKERTELLAAFEPRDELPLVVALAIVAVVGVVAGGWAALLAVPLLLLPGRSHQLPGLAALGVALAALVVWLSPGGLPQDQDGTFSPAAQGAAVFVLLCLAVSLVPDDWPGRLRRKDRSGGADGAVSPAGSTPSSPPRSDEHPRSPGTGTSPGGTGTPDRPGP